MSDFSIIFDRQIKKIYINRVPKCSNEFVVMFRCFNSIHQCWIITFMDAFGDYFYRLEWLLNSFESFIKRLLFQSIFSQQKKSKQFSNHFFCVTLFIVLIICSWHINYFCSWHNLPRKYAICENTFTHHKQLYLCVEFEWKRKDYGEN